MSLQTLCYKDCDSNLLRATRVLLAVAALILINSITIYSQSNDSKTLIDCVSLKMIEQKPAPKTKEKPAPDVIVEVPDDLHIRFELKNNCDENIYYLAYTILDNKVPAGFMIYRDRKDGEWWARSPGWGREGIFTDPFSYRWEQLKKEESVEFEYSDLSRIKGERSVSIFINYAPTQEKRVGLKAIPFSITLPEKKPIKDRKSKI